MSSLPDGPASDPVDASVSRPRAPLSVRLLPALAGIILLFLVLWFLNGESLGLPELGAPSAAPRVGTQAPDFTLAGADGQTIKLSDLRGKRVVLNFWATWCPPCRAEMPDIDRVASDYRDQGVMVLAVDQLESPDKVAFFFSDVGIGASPAVVPVFDSEGSVAQDYRVTALPSTFVLDADGVIRDVTLGPMTESSLRSKLDRLK